jgi:hypothetical protein
MKTLFKKVYGLIKKEWFLLLTIAVIALIMLLYELL